MGEIEHLGKTRLHAQGRSEGDGMENVQFIEASNKQKIFSVISEAPQTKSFPQKFITTPGKRKEPKFVPYEPYKAAVSPIILSTHDKERFNFLKCVVPQKANSLTTMLIKNNSIETESLLPNSDFNNLPVEKECCCKLNNGISNAEQKIFLEEKIHQLQREKKELETQFGIQTQVNTDLKKMLLASLGEDMQLKVQYMTEDKVKLGKDVLLYSEQLCQKNEDIEKLSVECDVWKSKFEASSLMVKELARFKAVLTLKLNEVTQALESVLQEHEEIYEQQYISHSILQHIQGAFSPSYKPKDNHCAWNLLHLCKETSQISNTIQERLLGSSSLGLKSVVVPKCGRHFTSAENLAYKVITGLETLPTLMKLESCKETTHGPGATACQILPHVCPNDTTINCCQHCSGEIMLV